MIEEKKYVVIQGQKKLTNKPVSLSEAKSIQERMSKSIQESGQNAPAVEIKEYLVG